MKNSHEEAVLRFREKQPCFCGACSLVNGEAAFDFLQEELTRAEEKERAICRTIFVDEVDWSEWGLSEKEAGERFDEARTSPDRE